MVKTGYEEYPLNQKSTDRRGSSSPNKADPNETINSHYFEGSEMN